MKDVLESLHGTMAEQSGDSSGHLALRGGLVIRARLFTLTEMSLSFQLIEARLWRLADKT